MYRVFVDGQHGTTGLEIHRLLGTRADLQLLTIGADDKKVAAARQRRLNEADVVILCLPDDAAREAVQLIDNQTTRVLDASTAHRVAADWVYGLPELPGQRQRLIGSKRVSVPGCYPTGFLLAVRPLIDAGIIPKSLPLAMHAVSGYSGGGRKLIDRFEARAQSARSPDELFHGQAYALSMTHKHLAEMRHYSGTDHTPLFAPSVGHYYRGMLVCVPLFASQLAASATPASIVSLWRDHYAGEQFVEILDAGGEPALDEGFLDPQCVNHRNTVQLMAFGNEERMLLVARLDNLGKGAAGGAVQNLNLMLGLREATGLKP